VVHYDSVISPEIYTDDFFEEEMDDLKFQNLTKMMKGINALSIRLYCSCTPCVGLSHKIIANIYNIYRGRTVFINVS